MKYKRFLVELSIRFAAMAGKILIVEDDVRLADIFAKLLKHAGYDTSQADTSKQGIIKALAERPDLIVTDLHLPDMIAIEPITILKSNPNTSDIPVIVLTAESVKDWKPKAFEVGAVEYLRKPISAPDLIQLVRRFCPPVFSDFEHRRSTAVAYKTQSAGGRP